MAARCGQDECYVPAIPIAVGIAAGGGIGALIGVLIDR